MKLFIIRHCQTTGNASFKLQGAKTPGQLTERGRLQLAALKRFFSHEKIQAVYSSPLQRAQLTARGLSSKRPIVLPELIEIDFGDLEGATHEETKADQPDLFNDIFDNPKKRFPNGESLQDVQDRLQPLVKKLQSQDGNPTVVIVGHNILNRVLLATLLDLPLEHCRMFKLKNASIAEIDANPHHRRLYLLHNGFASIGKDKDGKKK
ncbi:histidine phosphatase family protein [Candidatus Micrarchaeota archaeon]|nr:histidine phosphatase family protein [Candidatus Micrarchaeota archaeon]